MDHYPSEYWNAVGGDRMENCYDDRDEPEVEY